MVHKTSFGTLRDGREVSLYTISYADGRSASFTDYGASVVSVVVPDRNGKLAVSLSSS